MDKCVHTQEHTYLLYFFRVFADVIDPARLGPAVLRVVRDLAIHLFLRHAPLPTTAWFMSIALDAQGTGSLSKGHRQSK